jgi:hypothetical protein
MRPRFASASAAVIGVFAATSALGAQETLLPTVGWGVGTSLSAWHFSTPIPQSGGALADLVEIAIPFRVRWTAGRWGFDVSGAGAVGAVHFTANPSQQAQGSNDNGGDGGDNGERLTTLFGPTDVKLRATGPVMSDNLLMTVGLNLPSGKVGLNSSETSTLQAIGAPALRMPVGAFGTGAGATVGLIRAFEGDDWAVAIGGSVEQRTEYSPIALVLTDGKAETRVTPGTAAHVTLGIDRALGENRMSALLVGDVFSKDKVQLVTSAGPQGGSNFQLGPQVTLTTRLDLAASRWRESSFNFAARMRGEFSDSAGAKVSGSSGTYLEGSIGGVRGGPEGAGFLIGADARWHSGLKFTDALVGAAVTAVGVSIGWEAARESSTTRFVLHGQYGSFDTGTAKSTGLGVTLGLSIGARREAR